MSEEIIPVTFNTLLKVFKDREFQGNIRKLDKIMDKERIESEFIVYKDLFSDSYEIGEVFRGSLEGFSMKREGRLHMDEVSFDEYHQLIDSHTHGEEADSLFPSGGDLWGINMFDTYNYYPLISYNRMIHIICKSKENRRIKLFLVQQISKKPLSVSFLDEVSDEIYGKDGREKEDLTEEEVVNRFRRTGFYRADIVALTNRGFSDRDLNKLKQFEYSFETTKDYVSQKHIT